MSQFSFGKYRGKDIEEVPSDYLRWFVLQDFAEEKHPDLLKEAEEELKYRDTWNTHFYSEG